MPFEQPGLLHHSIEGGRLRLGHSIQVMQNARPVDAEPDEEPLLAQEWAQRSVSSVPLVCGAFVTDWWRRVCFD